MTNAAKKTANKKAEDVQEDDLEEETTETVAEDGETVIEQLPGGGTRERPSRRYSPGHE